MKKRYFFEITYIALLVSALSCSQAIEKPFYDRSGSEGANTERKNEGPEVDNNGSNDYWLRTTNQPSFFTRSLYTDTSLTEDQNLEFCIIPGGSEIEIVGQATMVNDDSLYVYLQDSLDSDCSLDEGYMYIGSLERVSHEIKPVEIDDSTSNPFPGTPGGSQPPENLFESPAVLEFPLDHVPFQDFTGAPRSFASARDGGRRSHAAADLYSATTKDVTAIADGRVIDYYYFYSGTYAVVVEHPEVDGMKIVRYGEIGALAPGIKVGKIVRRGDVLAKVGRINCCHPMLHFEGYKGTLTGPLTASGTRFKRRADLINPTAVLMELQGKL